MTNGELLILIKQNLINEINKSNLDYHYANKIAKKAIDRVFKNLIIEVAINLDANVDNGE